MVKDICIGSRRKLVVLTPVKNEAWILPLFCQSASIWADYIIIADQGSTDGSKEIAMRYPKVVTIDNDSADLDEDYRDRMLVAKARELVGNNGILFKIDADEIFTPNFNSPEWNRIKQSEAGTIWTFKWIHFNKNFSSCYLMHRKTVYGAFVDDGREYTSHGLIHVREMFQSDKNRVAEEIFVLHFQMVDWNRMQSKHRWYQCFEHINFPQKSAIDIYRMYHWMYNPKLPYKKIPNEWIDDYKEKYNINLFDYKIDKYYWWDDKVKEYLSVYSPQYFRRIETCKLKELPFAKGKNFLDKLLLFYLYLSTRTYNRSGGRLRLLVHKIDNKLKQWFNI